MYFATTSPNTEITNVLSLFDGLGGGYLALDRVGIKPTKYFASEVDKYAIAVAEALHPDIVKLGDVTKWREWDLPKIDLLIGGSPCQSFSFAGKRNGMSTGDIEVTSLEQYEQLKADDYQFDGQSYLFWEYVAILKHYKPKYFLLENVRMAKRWQRIISDALGIKPVMINSALVSAQNRKRLYWTNILTTSDLLGHLYTAIPQPEDRKIYLKDIIDNDVENNKLIRQKSKTIRCKVSGGNRVWNEVTIRQKSKSVRIGGRYSYDRREWDSVDDAHTRKFNVYELARLQTLPDDFVDVAKSIGTSNTQITKMIGNGWTIDVIAHIFSFLEKST